MPHQHVIDDLPAYSLSALDVDDRERVESHLRACPSCRLSLSEYDDVVVRLAGSLVSPAAPFAGWDQLAPQLGLGSHHGGRGGWRSGLSVITTPALRWGAVAAAIAALFVWNVALQTSNSGAVSASGTEVMRLAIAGDGAVVPLAGSGTTGRLYLSEDRTQGGLAVSGLPALSGNDTYRIWFIRKDQTRVAGGDFQVDSHGQALVKVDLPMPFAGFEGAGITREASATATSPTGTDILAGPIYEQ